VANPKRLTVEQIAAFNRDSYPKVQFSVRRMADIRCYDDCWPGRHAGGDNSISTAHSLWRVYDLLTHRALWLVRTCWVKT
jgi:hypothetical protein